LKGAALRFVPIHMSLISSPYASATRPFEPSIFV
jgi:hypothetical protein